MSSPWLRDTFHRPHRPLKWQGISAQDQNIKTGMEDLFLWQALTGGAAN